MAWGATDIPDQSGRVVVVTGGNGGLGLETTRELARHGAHVVMAARNLEKAEAARAEIKAEVRAASLEVRHLDLSSLDSIRKTAAGVVADHSLIDLLVNNAGVMATPRRETSDGFELQFGTNHLGHFALTRLLMPSLLAAIAARIVSVTSTGRHFGGNVDPDDPHFTKEYGRWKAYGRSKKANLHFGFELNRRLLAAGSQARSLVAHPGLANTDLLGQSSRSTGGTGRSRTFLHNIVQRVSQFTGPGCVGAAPCWNRSQGEGRSAVHAAMGRLGSAGVATRPSVVQVEGQDAAAVGDLRRPHRPSFRCRRLGDRFSLLTVDRHQPRWWSRNPKMSAASSMSLDVGLPSP